MHDVITLSDVMSYNKFMIFNLFFHSAKAMEYIQMVLIFDIRNFKFLGKNIPLATSYSVYITQLIRFTRVSSQVAD